MSHSIDEQTVTRLLEGLPHPMWERELYDRECQRHDVMRLGDSVFYTTPLDVAPEVIRDVVALAQNAASYTPKAPGEFRRCGRFHADYAVEWSDSGSMRQVLICFGCGEAILRSPHSAHHVDLTPHAEKSLTTLLNGVRQLRPLRPGLRR